MFGQTLVVNVASQRVMDKLGMVLVAEEPAPEDMQAVEGSERGGYRYEITQEQWEQRQAAQ